MLVTEVTRWRRDVEQFAADRLAEFDQGIVDALKHPAPVEARVMVRAARSYSARPARLETAIIRNTSTRLIRRAPSPARRRQRARYHAHSTPRCRKSSRRRS